MRTKLGLLGLCTVVMGMMAMFASSAQALSLDWLVLNAAQTVATLVTGHPANLPAPVQLEKDSTHLTLLFKFVKLMVSLTCTNAELVGSVALLGDGELTLGKAKFTGCEVWNGAALVNKLPCIVKTLGTAAGTIEAKDFTSKLVLHTLTGGGTEVLLQVKPDVGNAIVEILLEGPECPLPGITLTGSLFLKDCQNLALTHGLRHLVEQAPLTALLVGPDTAEHLETSLIGSVWARLVGTHNDLHWSAMVTP